MRRLSRSSGLRTALRCAVLGAVLATAACGGGGGDTAHAPEPDHLGDGSLGTVEVPAGDAVQIRSLNTITGDVAYLGIPNQRGVELAVADFGPVRGFDVDLGTRYDDLCSSDGEAAAQIIVADEDVVGVIGPSCSIGPVRGFDVDLGTRYDDLCSSDGDPYSRSIAQAFADSFERLGGDVTGFSAINKEDTDMVPVLTEVATGSPEALFFPIFQPAGDFLTEQAHGVPGLEETILLTDAALLNDGFMSLPQSAGLYFSGPDLRFGATANESTGQTPDSLLATYAETYGEPPSAPYWAHAYDAATLLLEAIEAASKVEDATLVIDRAGVRQYLNAVSGYRGIIGTINCDSFGDCGSQKTTVIHHLDPGDIEASLANVVFEFAS